MVPLIAGCEVVLFIATMGADGFADFVEGFFTELMISIGDRLLLEKILAVIGVMRAFIALWTRTRGWFWSILLNVLSFLKLKQRGKVTYNMKRDINNDHAIEDEDDEEGVEQKKVSGGEDEMDNEDE